MRGQALWINTGSDYMLSYYVLNGTSGEPLMVEVFLDGRQYTIPLIYKFFQTAFYHPLCEVSTDGDSNIQWLAIRSNPAMVGHYFLKI